MSGAHAQIEARAGPAPSIAGRLGRSLLLWLGMVLVLAGAGIYLFVRSTLLTDLDDSLRASAAILAREVEYTGTVDSPNIEVDLGSDDAPEYLVQAEAKYFQVWSAGPPAGNAGEVVARSPSLNGGDLTTPAPSSGESIEDVVLPDGRRGRALLMVFDARYEGPDDDSRLRTPAPQFLLCVAFGREGVDRTLTSLAIGLVGVGLASAAVLWLAVRRTIRRELAPAVALANAVGALDPARLPARIDVEGVPRELEPVRAGLDALLVRAGATIDRERRFAGAAAHELRTPLAELGAMIDVRAQWPESQERCVETLSGARRIVSGMARSITMLMSLARARTVGEAMAPGAVDAAPVLRAAMKRHQLRSTGGGLGVTLDAPQSATVWADPGALEAIVDNVVSNALGHTRVGGSVAVTLRELTAPTATAWSLEITNGPTDLGPADLERIFEPFWRKDAARGGGDDGMRHAGLGLSIVRDLADAMGWELAASLGPERRFTMRVVMGKPIGVASTGATGVAGASVH